MTRRIPALVIVIAAIAAILYVGRERLSAEAPTFSIAASGWMPAAPPPGGVTETWFCPGVPTAGVEGAGGEVIVANRGSQRLVGSALLMNENGQNVRLDVEVAGWSTARIDLDATLQGEMVAAVVEIEGGGALVEQWAEHPSGDSHAACANATSDTWYLADGFTVDGSLDQIVLTNPFEQTVVANLSFATIEGPRQPGSYRGLTIPPQSVRVIDLGAPGAGAQSEPLLAVTVETARGRLVVGRSQRFLGGGRLGTQVTLASPAVRNQWWFANGRRDSDTATRYSVYNPTSEDVEVDVLFLGLETPLVLDPIEVPAREVITIDTAEYAEADLPIGRHAAVFATSTNEAAIVVERAESRTLGDEVGTTVAAGATARQDGYLPSTWHVASGPETPVTEGLVIYNWTNSPGAITVSAIGSSGPAPVPGLSNVPILEARLLVLDLTDPLVIGRELLIEATTPVLVERSYPIGRDDLRSASWAIPAS